MMIKLNKDRIVQGTIDGGGYPTTWKSSYQNADNPGMDDPEHEDDGNGEA
jgi:hypothetical protein